MQMAQRARQRGIKVLLTGEGADELFGGYINPRGLPFKAFLSPSQRVTREIEQLLRRPPRSTAQGLTRRLRKLLGAAPPRRSGFSTTQSQPSSGTPDDEAIAAEVEAAYENHTGPRRDCETLLLRDFDFTISHLLNRMDKNMMQVSVEARVPFLDPRVVELALNLPLEARVTPWTKGILRDVARRLLPLSTASRWKIFGMNFDAGAWIEEGARPEFLSQGVFREVFEVPSREFASLMEASHGPQRVRLWSTEVWCRSVFAGQAVPVIEKDLWPEGP
jgi:asparagine synthase (glutamine-hydrolysing)